MPDHIFLLKPDTNISTLSLYSIGDFCLTVRGTVGIECASYGLVVITAGDGRYDKHGFTIDIKNISDYKKLLKNIHLLPKMSKTKIELAQKFAFGVFLMRPIELTSINFMYQKTREADLDVSLNMEEFFDFKKSYDTNVIKDWLDSGNYDFIDKHLTL